MFKILKNILFVVSIALVFTSQASQADDKDKQRPSARSSNQSRPQEQVKREPQNQGRSPQPRREAPRPVEYRQPAAQEERLRSNHQEREAPRVYATAPQVLVSNNNLFHRQHHQHWQPRYNFYDNQYHFYPYVNIASKVELSSACVPAGFNGQAYFYDEGTFYLQDQGGQYVAIPPPVGIVVNPIVSNARQVVVGNQIFYRYKGVFYVQVNQGYQVIEPVQPSPDE